jgi:ADP-heptose:LPS heptosyltransferase
MRLSPVLFGLLQTALRPFRSLVLWILDGIAIGTCNRGASGAVAVLRLDAIGDFLLWLGSAEAIRAQYAGQRLVLIGNSAWTDLAKRLTLWDEVWGVDVRRFIREPLYRWRCMRRARRYGFAIAVQPTFARAFLVGDSLVRATGAPERIGSHADFTNIAPWEKRISDRWYTSLVSARNEPMMEILRNCEFTQQLTGRSLTASLARLPIVSELSDDLRFKRPYFVVFPGASWVGKRWPIERFASVVADIQRETGWLALLCGSPTEQGLCEELLRQMSGPACSIAGKTSLADSCEVIRAAELVLSNDTSAIHIAAAVSTPSIGIVGGGHFGRFLPYPDSLSAVRPRAMFKQMPCYNCNWRCTQPHVPGGPVPCITAVQVESVVAAAKDLVRSAKDQSRRSNTP